MDDNLDVADVIRKFIEPYEEQFGSRMLPSHRRAVRDILGCMTETMGGGRYQCRDCEETFWSYHGCRNRACPKCHGRQIAEWMKKRTAELLPCDYFHVVATVPAELRSFFLQEQKLLYGIFMKTAGGALCELARDKRYVGAAPGIMAVLHTWTGRMHHHPHAHLLATGGGLSADGSTWHGTANNFLVPVKKLSPLIAKRFAETLKKERPELFDRIPPNIWKKEWCSFCKHFGTGRKAVLRYLARYVFRIAITSNRIMSIDGEYVFFQYKDNGTGVWKTERIRGIDFIRRFLLHVLPKGFHKVRYYGLWSVANQSRHHAARLQLLLALKQNAAEKPVLIADLAEEALTQSDIESHAFVIKCPRCNSSNVLLLMRLRRGGTPMPT